MLPSSIWLEGQQFAETLTKFVIHVDAADPRHFAQPIENIGLVLEKLRPKKKQEKPGVLSSHRALSTSGHPKSIS
jgi:hypothetical protein